MENKHFLIITLILAVHCLILGFLVFQISILNDLLEDISITLKYINRNV
ncbi:hypothetical protein GCM10010954_29480 [Halobacillus andaensis]|uniref:Uncharacterized protein n=1 Tax=Halobacillus andaensis TaxID=1176239 RepID=A0A917EWW5_HALAA|nr:hypothetical protein [Halobacillus andaensis]GGF28516.1 hypothetical protein GCM10010954_29480 [Halobacillus andaensis]